MVWLDKGRSFDGQERHGFIVLCWNFVQNLAEISLTRAVPEEKTIEPFVPVAQTVIGAMRPQSPVHIDTDFLELLDRT